MGVHMGVGMNYGWLKAHLRRGWWRWNKRFFQRLQFNLVISCFVSFFPPLALSFVALDMTTTCSSTIWDACLESWNSSMGKSTWIPVGNYNAKAWEAWYNSNSEWKHHKRTSMPWRNKGGSFFTQPCDIRTNLMHLQEKKKPFNIMNVFNLRGSGNERIKQVNIQHINKY